MLAVLGCGQQPATLPTGEGFVMLDADQVIYGFEQYITKNGRNTAVMRGDTAHIYEDSMLAKVKNSSVVLYDERGNVSARLKSKTGVVHSGTQRMIARGNVVLTTDAGRTIETEELHYDPETHRVWSTVRTVQRYQGGVLTGTGFDADDKFQNVRITGASSRGGGMRIQF
jgi:LPS export ABC transporter protein LptC